MPIVLDAMGSDNYPDPEIQAAVQASQMLHEEIILVGKEALIAGKLAGCDTGHHPVRIVDAPDVWRWVRNRWMPPGKNRATPWQLAWS